MQQDPGLRLKLIRHVASENKEAHPRKYNKLVKEVGGRKAWSTFISKAAEEVRKKYPLISKKR